jgi:hypothetical protein
MLPDHYKGMGPVKTATKEYIKKRYREFARKYHPDVNISPGSIEKCKKFGKFTISFKTMMQELVTIFIIIEFMALRGIMLVRRSDY